MCPGPCSTPCKDGRVNVPNPAARRGLPPTTDQRSRPCKDRRVDRRNHLPFQNLRAPRWRLQRDDVIQGTGQQDSTCGWASVAGCYGANCAIPSTRNSALRVQECAEMMPMPTSFDGCVVKPARVAALHSIDRLLGCVDNQVEW